MPISEVILFWTDFSFSYLLLVQAVFSGGTRSGAFTDQLLKYQPQSISENMTMTLGLTVSGGATHGD